jgi:hypothetical protein
MGEHKVAGVKPLLNIQVFLNIFYENGYDAGWPQAYRMKK